MKNWWIRLIGANIAASLCAPSQDSLTFDLIFHVALVAAFMMMTWNSEEAK